MGFTSCHRYLSKDYDIDHSSLANPSNKAVQHLEIQRYTYTHTGTQLFVQASKMAD